ncbi:MAG TPA: polysaccharide deacetylase family protein [Bacteroidota bacterium]|nr:polysaccharide deacetylase family protein [Bacteroidota bacterium]
MNLKVGILGNPDGWQLLLTQEGVSFGNIQSAPSPDEYSVIVVSSNTSEHYTNFLHAYVEEGGTVLCSAQEARKVFQHPIRIRPFHSALPAKEFSGIDVIDIFAPCWLSPKSNALELPSGQSTAFIGHFGRGSAIILPFDPAEIVLDERTAIKSFYSPEQRLPFEHVSLVSKHSLRQLVSRCLELLHHRRGLPYVHLWYFPNGMRSVGTFRVDTDFGTPSEITRLYETAQQHQVPMTWFVDVKSQQPHLSLFKEMANQEIGIHGFEHKTFSDYRRNFENIRQAQTTMNTAGLFVKGFTAPFGSWNKTLARALSKAGIEYSSEFSYDYDNLPSVPSRQNDNGTLQIPVHPICIGSLKRHGYSDEQMIHYFDFVIQRNLAMREPLFFYHHPRDGHHAVLEWFFEKMSGEHIPLKTMSYYAQWWKQRAAAIPEIFYSSGNLSLKNFIADRSIQVHISMPDGMEAMLPLSEQILFETVRWRQRPEPWLAPEDYLRMRKFNYRIPLVRGLDAVMNVWRRK